MTMTKREFRTKYARQIAEYEKAVASGNVMASRCWEIIMLDLLRKAGL